jgi:hypothetical protein
MSLERNGKSPPTDDDLRRPRGQWRWLLVGVAIGCLLGPILNYLVRGFVWPTYKFEVIFVKHDLPEAGVQSMQLGWQAYGASVRYAAFRHDPPANHKRTECDRHVRVPPLARYARHAGLGRFDVGALASWLHGGSRDRGIGNHQPGLCCSDQVSLLKRRKKCTAAPQRSNNQ